MKLIVDSGSTKTDWCIIHDTQATTFKTSGLNPYFVDSHTISKIITEHFPQQFSPSDISNIFFYGAGCKAEEPQKIIFDGLRTVFPNPEIEIENLKFEN